MWWHGGAGLIERSERRSLSAVATTTCSAICVSRIPSIFRLHLEVKTWKMGTAKKESRNNQDSECLPIADHSEIEYLWHCDVPEPLEDRYQYEEEDNAERDN